MADFGECGVTSMSSPIATLTAAPYGISVAYTGTDNLPVNEALEPLLPYLCNGSRITTNVTGAESVNIRLVATFQSGTWQDLGGLSILEAGQGYIIELDNSCADDITVITLDIETFEWPIDW